MARGINSLQDLKKMDYEFEKEIEVAVHKDENIANNRLFVWNFEKDDLETFLEFFEIYKNSTINVSTRQALSGNLMRKINSMMREGYNPVECMLYASKIINMKLQNDKELQEILGERIKDVYLKQEEETIAVIENIIDMWTWIPQINVVITAIGIIGDNEKLLDDIMYHYAEDSNYKIKVFYALMKNKSFNNLERVMKIIMNLQDTQEDNRISRAFVKEIAGFGYEGIKIVEKYYENPAISLLGGKTLKKIMLKEMDGGDREDDNLFRHALAKNSYKDDMAYKEFLEDCYEKYDSDAFYLSRFSRPDIGSFLKEALEDNRLNNHNKNTAIVSMGVIGTKGYSPASAIINACEKRGENEYAVIIANIFLGNEKYANKLADILSIKKDYELQELYRVLRGSNIVNYNTQLISINKALEKKFGQLLEIEDYNGLECLVSNFQIFWDKKLYSLLSKDILEQMRGMLINYVQNSMPVPQTIIISIIETIIHSWNSSIEKVLFMLLKNSDNKRVQDISFKKLKEREIEAPK